MTDNQKIQKIKGILALLREEREKVHAQKLKSEAGPGTGFTRPDHFRGPTKMVMKRRMLYVLLSI